MLMIDLWILGWMMASLEAYEYILIWVTGITMPMITYLGTSLKIKSEEEVRKTDMWICQTELNLTFVGICLLLFMHSSFAVIYNFYYIIIVMNTLIKYNYTLFDNKVSTEKELYDKIDKIKIICNKYLIIDYNYIVAKEILDVIMS